MKKTKAKAGKDQVATAYPHHSTISPRKLAPDTSSNIPPVQEQRTAPHGGRSPQQRRGEAWGCRTTRDPVHRLSRLPQVTQDVVAVDVDGHSDQEEKKTCSTSRQ